MKKNTKIIAIIFLILTRLTLYFFWYKFILLSNSSLTTKMILLFIPVISYYLHLPLKKLKNFLVRLDTSIETLNNESNIYSNKLHNTLKNKIKIK